MRPVTALLVALPVAAAPLAAQRVEYAPGTTRYLISTTTTGTQTSAMGNRSFQLGLDQRLTVSLTKPARDTMVATLTIDSLKMRTEEANVPDVSHLAGSTFVLRLSPTGKVYDTKAPAGGDQILAQLSEGVSRFLPTFRADLHVGETWADTTTGKVTQQGLQVDRTIIASYKVTGDTAIAGEPAFKVKRLTNVKATGGGTSGGQAVTLQSTTQSDADFLIGKRGVFLGGNTKDDVNLKVTVVAQNSEILITQQARTKIEALR